MKPARPVRLAADLLADLRLRAVRVSENAHRERRDAARLCPCQLAFARCLALLVAVLFAPPAPARLGLTLVLAAVRLRVVERFARLVFEPVIAVPYALRARGRYAMPRGVALHDARSDHAAFPIQLR